MKAHWTRPALVALWSASLAFTVAAASDARPNMVIFIADDLTWHDVACFGGPTDAKTPQLAKLAREGVKLTQFFSPASVCSPTRQSLLTGIYPIRNGAYPNHSVVRPGTKTLPTHLATLGYRTACIGKTHFGPPECYPFDSMITMLGEASGDTSEDSGDGSMDLGGIKKFIREDPSRPFCLYVATHEPHGPWTKGDHTAYDPAKLKLPPYLIDTAITRRELANYLAEVSCLDQEVGEISNLLEQSGHTTDTLFLFFSEQGSSMPHGKWTCYDPGIHAAAIARWPGKIKPGSENPAMIQYVDVLPTLIEIAGGKPTEIDTGCADATGNRQFDGSSFLPVLLGTTARHRDLVFAEHTARGISNGPEAYGTRAVRDERWKLIVNLEPEATFQNNMSRSSIVQSWRKKGNAGDSFATEQVERYTKRPALELYDLSSDPWELYNIASDPQNQDTINRLRGSLDAWMHQQGDLGDPTEREAKKHQVKR